MGAQGSDLSDRVPRIPRRPCKWFSVSAGPLIAACLNVGRNLAGSLAGRLESTTSGCSSRSLQPSQIQRQQSLPACLQPAISGHSRARNATFGTPGSEVQRTQLIVAH